MKIQKLFHNNNGVAIIEMAIILPVLLVIIFAVLEFGNYYMRQLIAQRAVSTISNYVQNVYPNSTWDDANTINNAVTLLAPTLGSGFIPVANLGNANFCGRAYPDQAGANAFANADYSAKNALCLASGFAVGRANSGTAPTAPYFVGIVLVTPYTTLTALPALAGLTMPHNIVVRSVLTLQPGASDVPRSAGGTPVSCGQNEKVVYDSASNGYFCRQIVNYGAIRSTGFGLGAGCGTNEVMVGADLRPVLHGSVISARCAPLN